MSTEAESFAYGSSMYGGRPTFGLTRRLGDNAGLTLYEFVPEDMAEARQKRLGKASKKRTFSQVPITKALPQAKDNLDEGLDFSEIGMPSNHTPADWHWDGWYAMKIARLTGSRQQAVTELVRHVLEDNGIDSNLVTRGEGSVVLPEDAGIRLAIAFLAMHRVRKYERLTTIADSLSRMSLQECYYWHAKCRSPSSPNGIKALRVLLAGRR